MHLAGLFIGGTLSVVVKLGGKFSGAVFNPAVAIGMFVLKNPDADNEDGGKYLLYYILSQLVGGVLAGCWTSYCHIPSLTTLAHPSVNKENPKQTADLQVDKSNTRIQPLDETNRKLEQGASERKGTEEAKEELQPGDVLGHVLAREEPEQKD